MCIIKLKYIRYLPKTSRFYGLHCYTRMKLEEFAGVFPRFINLKYFSLLESLERTTLPLTCLLSMIQLSWEWPWIRHMFNLMKFRFTWFVGFSFIKRSHSPNCFLFYFARHDLAQLTWWLLHISKISCVFYYHNEITTKAWTNSEPWLVLLQE